MPTRKSAKSTNKSTKLTRPKTIQAKKKTLKIWEALRAYAANSNKRLRLILGIALIALLLYLFRGFFLVAMVNGEPITRLSVIRELERQGGKQIVSSLITRKLILQEAKKRNVTLTQQDIERDLAKIEENYKQQGQTLDQVLKEFGVSREEVIEQRKPWILLEKMVSKDIVITDEEVQKFIDENNKNFGGTLKKDQVKQDLYLEKLQQKQQEFIAKLQKDAKIYYIVNY
jgi:foldase protein PrsA